MANFSISIPLWACAATAALLPAQDKQQTARAEVPAKAAARAVQGAVKAAPTIGTVDLDKAIDAYGLAIKERERLQQLSEQFGQEFDAMQQRMDEVRAELSILEIGSAAYEEKEFELRAVMQRQEGFSELRKRQFNRELEAFELAVYEDLEYAINKVATDRGIDLVLRTRETFTPAPEEAGSLGRDRARLVQFNRRTVWFASAKVDLTPFLIKYLQAFDVRGTRQKAAAEAAGKGAAPAKAAGGNKEN